MPDIEHAVHLIDQTHTATLPRCHQCNTVLRRHGPSLDFCGDLCQTAWHQNRAAGPSTQDSVATHPQIHSRVIDDTFLRLEADYRAWETYRATPPPGPLESLWNRITRRWRKR